MAARSNPVKSGNLVPTSNSKGRRSTWVSSVFFGMLLAGLTLAAGAAVIFARPTGWEAQSTLIVLPSERKSASETSDASLFELLNQGQVVTTYSALLGNQAFSEEVTRTAGVRARPISLAAAPLPDTFLIRLTASAPTAVDAGRLVQVAAERAPQYVGDLRQPFTVRALDATGVTATRRTAATPALAVTLLIIAILVGVTAQQGFLQLRRVATRPGEASGDP